MPTRTPSEIAILKAEAERRVRAGENHTDVARVLGVSLSTLGNWASEGRWRRKDLAFDLDETRGSALLATIAERAARDLAAVRKRNEETRQLADAARAALRAADPDGEGRPTALAQPANSARTLALAMARGLLEQGRIDEADRAARFALRFAQAEQASHEHERAQWRADRASIMKWWEDNAATFRDYEKRATEMSEELEGAQRFEQDMAEEKVCPTCVRPMEFWPAAMDEKMDQLEEERDKKHLTQSNERRA